MTALALVADASPPVAWLLPCCEVPFCWSEVLCCTFGAAGGHSGMFPCFFGGSVSRFVRSARNASTICDRVSCGMITRST